MKASANSKAITPGGPATALTPNVNPFTASRVDVSRPTALTANNAATPETVLSSEYRNSRRERKSESNIAKHPPPASAYKRTLSCIVIQTPLSRC